MHGLVSFPISASLNCVRQFVVAVMLEVELVQAYLESCESIVCF